jgi:hypothetical protein
VTFEHNAKTQQQQEQQQRQHSSRSLAHHLIEHCESRHEHHQHQGCGSRCSGQCAQP